MARLILTPNLADPDRIYAQLVSLVEGEADAAALGRCLRLVLALANHVGDPETIAEAIDLAARGATHPEGRGCAVPSDG
jgi:hypothetical protein